MAVELAAAYVSIVPSLKGVKERVQRELGDPLEDAAKRTGEKMGDQISRGVNDSIKGAAAKLGAAFAGVQVGGFLKGAVDSAIDTGEQLSKLNVLLGESSKEVDDWSKQMADSFGISRRSALTAAGDFATFFRGVGKSTDEASKMSKEFVELAADMASFSNATPEEAITALGAALRGESEPIRRFGVLLDDATLKQRALNEGLTDSTKGTLPPAIKLQAAYAEILAQTAVQQGDVARTSDSLANQQRRLSAQFDDAKAQLGAGLLPIFQRLVDVFADDLLPAFQNAIPTIVEMTDSLFNAGSAVAGFLSPLSGIGFIFGELAVGAAAALFAVQKIEAGIKIAQASFATFQATTATLTGGLSLLAGLLAGGLLLAFTAFAADAAQAKEDQNKLTEALLEAGDPTQRLAVELGGLVDNLGKFKPGADGAKKAVEGITESFIANVAASDKTLDSLNEFGLSSARIAELTRDGGKAFDNAAQQALNLANGNSELALAIEGATGPQRELIQELFRAQAAGKITDRQLSDIFGTLNRVSEAYRNTANATKDSIDEDVAKAVSLGVVSEEWVEQQRLASGVADEYGQLTFVGGKLTEVLKNQGVEAPTVSAGLDAVAASSGAAATGQMTASQAADALEESQKAAADAAKAHDQAIKDLTSSVSAFVDQALGAEDIDDKWATTMAGLVAQVTKQTTENQAGAAALSGYTTAAIENRETLRSLVGVAAEDIQKRIEQGQTMESVQERARLLSDELLNNAANLGVSRDEAQRYADVILGAANQVGGLNVQLQALPTQKQIDLQIAVSMNLDDFRAKMQEVSQSFVDVDSRALVAAGITELPLALDLSGRAAGGPVAARQPVMVGERGPEVWWPDTAGTVVSNDQLVMAGGRGGITVENINVTEAQSAAAVVDEVHARLGWMLTTRAER